jgi:mannose-6-phosphate isomerase-like protein (cupin superfamily)
VIYPTGFRKTLGSGLNAGSPAEGEHLIRNAGNIFIKVDPSKGSNNMALGTQQLPIGRGIGVHQHQEADEVLFVLEGTGFGMLGDKRMPIEKGSAIYIPKGVWHGVENPDSVIETHDELHADQPTCDSPRRCCALYLAASGTS